MAAWLFFLVSISQIVSVMETLLLKLLSSPIFRAATYHSHTHEHAKKFHECVEGAMSFIRGAVHFGLFMQKWS
jgi:hypothetical protein